MALLLVLVGVFLTFKMNISQATGATGLPLPAEQAFSFHQTMDGQTVVLTFDIAEGYHLYRQRLKFTSKSQNLEVGNINLPEGSLENDAILGQTQVYRGHVEFRIPLIISQPLNEPANLELSYQGCQDHGSCYPPIRKNLTLKLTKTAAAEPATAVRDKTAKNTRQDECSIQSPEGFVEAAPRSEQCRIVDALRQNSIWWTAASFFGMGLLLAFTPCIFPMIPILSGIIAGHGHRMTTARAFALSLAYVLASSLTYTLFGVLAGMFGQNLQAIFQDPRIIIAFSALFVVLALSMFDVFTLQMPGFLQSRLTTLSNGQRGGTLLGSAVMGLLSALIVGPCVAAPLAGALIYIGQTGNAVLGGFALFALGMGMGVPLLIIGTSAGSILPRAGTWMNTVKGAFGLGLLGVAVWLLDRVVSPQVSMFLMAILLILPAIFLGALDALPQPATFLRKSFKGIGVIMLAYGLILLLGVASKASDPLNPLANLRPTVATGPAYQASAELHFQPVHTLSELKTVMAEANSKGRPVLVDVYADWCVSCKEMERETFNNPKVRQLLKDMVLIKADVTENSEESSELLKEYNLIGPPATLIFDQHQQEQIAYRIVGFMEPQQFVQKINQALNQPI